MKDMPAPTPQHRQLEKLVGQWQGEELMSPSPWDPAGGTALGSVSNRVAADGFAVVQDYEQKRNGAVSFRGHGVFHYSPSQSCYLLHWWDSMGMPVNEFRGQFEGDVLRMTCPSQQGHTRCSFDLSQPGRYSFTMDASQDGQNWMTLMSGTYAPRSSAPSAARPASRPAGKKKPMKAASRTRSARPKAARKKTAARAGKKTSAARRGKGRKK